MKGNYFLLLTCLLSFFSIGQGEVGYFVNTSGNLYKTYNSGVDWSNTFTNPVQHIEFVNDSTGYYTSTSGNLFKTFDSGENWLNTATCCVSFMDFINDSTGYHVSTSGNLYKTTNSGANWLSTSTCCVTSIDFINDSTGYQISTSGNLYKTTNSGIDWTDLVTCCVDFIDFVNDSTGYQVTTSGNLFKTTDSGNTWTSTSTGAVSLIDFVNDSTGYQVTTSGNLYKTYDSGENWWNTSTCCATFIDFVKDSINFTTYGIDYITSCDSIIWIDGNTYNSSNYWSKDTLINAAGFDSIVTLNLNIISIDTSITQTGSELTSNAFGSDYQWLSCPDMTPIVGATNQSFSPTLNGTYAVAITKNGCSDTSSCYSVNSLGIIENDFESSLVIFPNPTNGKFAIKFRTAQENVVVKIVDLNGQLKFSKSFHNKDIIDILFDEPIGTYILSIESNDNKATFKLLKE